MEVSRSKIVARLSKEGWQNVGGAKHDGFQHPTKTGFVLVPRHRTLSNTVARSIAKAAGWQD